MRASESSGQPGRYTGRKSGCVNTSPARARARRATLRDRPNSAALSSRRFRPAGLVRTPTEQLCLAMRAERRDELVEIAVEDLVELVEREADPVIGYAILREIVRADLLRSLGRPD